MMHFCPTIRLPIVTQKVAEMDFVTVREFRTEPAKVWAKLESEQELVITKNGKPFALLTTTQPNRLEEDLKLIRRARASASIERMRANAKSTGLNKMTLAEVNLEIAGARARSVTKTKNATGR